MKRRETGHESGSAPVSQFQLPMSGTSYSLPPTGTPGNTFRKVVTVVPGDWTADTTGYPNAALLDNQTLYRADVHHDLGSEDAACITIRTTSGLFATHRLQFQDNEDPANPGTVRTNISRIWISADSAPASDLYLLFMC